MKLLLLLAGAGAAVSQPAEQAARSPMFSAEQVETGQKLYEATCAACHGPQLDGEMGPSLIDAKFRLDFGGKPMRSLYSRIISTMPLGQPGSMNEAQTLSVTAFLAARNNMPIGERPVVSAAELSSASFPAPASWQ